MAVAVGRLSEIEGGFVVVEGGRVLAELALPVAGLMSLLSLRGGAGGAGCLAGGGDGRWGWCWRSRSCSWPSCACR